MKSLAACIGILILALAACGTAPVDNPTPVPTEFVVTAISSTVVPDFATPPPPGATAPPVPTSPPAKPIPTLVPGATPTELKYQVLAQFPNVFFCDPDYYPVARDDETDLARQRFPELQANTEEFQAILNHTGLGSQSTFTDEQKLLIYREHKQLAAVQFELAGDQYEFQLQVEENPGEGFIITGLINSVGSITVQQQESSFPTCPICLARQTRIDTPGGSAAVQDLQAGDIVWTVDATGARVSAPILKTVRVFVPANHQMVHVVLQDGRELWASPGHPTSDGGILADLKPGDFLGGAAITGFERVVYDQPATYDLLPSGGTGFYWANGILLASTLTP
jgi:hypothetical protein